MSAASRLFAAIALAGTLIGAASPRPAIIAVTIEENGGRSEGVSSDETVAQCRRFRLTLSQARFYLARSSEVDEVAYVHDLDMSRCFVAGRVRYSDGRVGEWSTDRERRGMIRFADGRFRYLYCLPCRSPPFSEADAETLRNARQMIRDFRNRVSQSFFD